MGNTQYEELKKEETCLFWQSRLVSLLTIPVCISWNAYQCPIPSPTKWVKVDQQQQQQQQQKQFQWFTEKRWN